MSLLTEADRAEDFGSAFRKFRFALDARATAEVDDLIAELRAVSSALHEIRADINSTDLGSRFLEIDEDLDLARSSLKFTLDDLFRILGKLGNGSPVPTPDDYRKTWRNIIQYFQGEGHGRLSLRLRVYTDFVQLLRRKLRRCVPSTLLFQISSAWPL